MVPPTNRRKVLLVVFVAVVPATFQVGYEQLLEFSQWRDSVSQSSTWQRQLHPLSRSSLSRRATVRNEGDIVVSCTGCEALLPPSAFGVNRRKRNGLQSRCKSCQAEYQRRYRQEIRKRNANLTHDKSAKFQCPCCQRSLRAADFALSRGMLNGLNRICRDCASIKYKVRAQRYKEANRAPKVPLVHLPPQHEKIQEALALPTAVARNRALSEIGMYCCPSCRKVKPFSGFHVDRHRRYGVRGHCKECSLQKRRSGKEERGSKNARLNGWQVRALGKSVFRYLAKVLS